MVGRNKTESMLAKFKRAFYGTEKLTTLRFFLVSGFFVSTGLCFYSFSMNFFPSERWLSIGQYVAIILASVSTAAYWWGVLQGKIDLNKADYSLLFRARFGKFVLLVLLLPGLLYSMYWISFILGVGKIYTKFAGDTVIREVRVSDKIPSRYGDYIESEDLGTGLFVGMRVQGAHYDVLDVGSILIIEGKETPIGFYATGYVPALEE